MNTKINNKGFASIMFFLSETMFLGVGISKILNSSKICSIYSIILGGLIGFIFLYLFNKIFNYEKDLNIFKKHEKLYGKTLGNIINLLITILFLLYFIYTLWSSNSYVQSKYLNNTPSIIITILFLVPVTICSLENFKTITKVSLNLFIFSLLIIIFSYTNLTSHVDIQNLKPFFNNSFFIIIKNAFVFASYSVSPLFMLLLIPKNEIENQTSKWNIIFYLIFIIEFIILFILIIGIFGIELSKLLYYPEFTLLKKINYFNFIQHIENILSAKWMYSLFITATTTLFFIKEYLKEINKEKIIYIIVLFSLIASLYLFKNTTIGYNFIKNYFIYILPIPIFILSLISNILIKLKQTN